MTDVLGRETFTRAALAFSPESLNRETGTVDATLSTGAPVQRSGFIERLAVGRENVTLADRIPVLDSHRQGSIADVLGRVVDVRFEAGRIDATLRISNPATLDAIERGDLTGISIGYRVEKWTDAAPSPGSMRTRTATKWHLLEASLVPIPADPSAFIRSEATMPAQVAAAEDTQQQQQPQIETRAAVNAQIRGLAETAGLDRAWADSQIDGEADIHAARAAAIEAMQVRQQQSGVTSIRAHVLNDNTDPTIIVQRQAEALAQRMGGPEASDPARQYVGFTFADYARDALQRTGERTERLSNETILQRAMMTTSDFPALMEEGGTRVVMSAYAAAESPLKQIATRRLVSSLNDVTVLKLGEASGLERVSEAGEIKHGVFGEGAESYKVETFARIFTLSRKVLINDQFGVFGDMMRQMGQLSAATEANALVDLLRQSNGAGPVMSDGKRLFHADHGNLATAEVGAPDIAALTEARLALRTQKGLDGVTPVGVTPKFLVVGPKLETAAEQILATLNATTAADQNPFAGKLALVVEPRILDSSWYVFGDQTTAPVLELAYLASAPGPQVQQREGWDTLGREWRITFDLGAGAVDHRGVFRNAGA